MKMGVKLVDIAPAAITQDEPDFGNGDFPNKATLMATVDANKPRFGRGTVGIGAATSFHGFIVSQALV